MRSPRSVSSASTWSISVVSGATAGQTAGGDDGGIAAELAAHAAHEPFDHVHIAPEQPRLHRPDRRAADHAVRLAHVDARQLRGALKQRVGRDLRARTNHAAQIFALRRDRIERRRRTEVDDDDGAACRRRPYSS